MKIPPPPRWLFFGIVLLALVILVFALPSRGQERSPDDWFALVAAIQRDVEQADFEGRKIPKLDSEDRKFIRKMANELTISPDARPTAAQGQWLISIRAWIDAAK